MFNRESGIQGSREGGEGNREAKKRLVKKFLELIDKGIRPSPEELTAMVEGELERRGK